MKKPFLYIMGALMVLVGVVSCDNNQTVDTTRYDIAQVTAFRFMKNDSFPGLKEAEFIIQELNDTGLIEVKDSLLYGTPLDSVTPVLTFYYSPYAAIIYTPFDTITYSGSTTDTINMSAEPMYVQVYSYDKSKVKWYRLRAYAHQVDPDLFSWNTLTTSIAAAQPAEQQALMVGDKMVMLANNGFKNTCYTSLDGALWQENSVSGLPTDCEVRRIICLDNVLYYADTTAMFTSTDALTWNKYAWNAGDYEPQTTLMAFDGQVWLLAYDKEEHLCIVSWRDGVIAAMPVDKKDGALPVSFPVSDFAVVSYTSSSEHEHVLIAGGYNRDGEMVNCHWNVEYNRSLGQYRVVDYAASQSGLAPFAGVAMVAYDNKMYAFGGVDSKGAFLSAIRYSTDEGLHWNEVDTVKNSLPADYRPRRNVSAFVYDKNIYLIGGTSATGTLMDAYKGRINSIDFLRK